MKITTTLLNWLQKSPGQQAAPSSPASPETSAPNQKTTSAATSNDSVRFSELAKKLSDAQKQNPGAEITFEERQALRNEFEPATYKPPLMQLAKKLLGIKIF